MTTMAAKTEPSACPMLDILPLELRKQIYDYVLFSDGSFFSLDDEIGVSVPSLFPVVRPHSPGGLPVDRLQKRRRRRANILALLLTSRQVSEEAADVLYSGGFFRLRGIAATTSFFAHTPARRLDQIRSLKLVWDDAGWIASRLTRAEIRAAWPALCVRLARMRGLRDLYVGLGIDLRRAATEAHYLGALRAVRPRDSFKVCVPVSMLEVLNGGGGGGGDDERYRDAPFGVCRHAAGELCQWRKEVLEAEAGNRLHPEGEHHSRGERAAEEAAAAATAAGGGWAPDDGWGGSHVQMRCREWV